VPVSCCDTPSCATAAAMVASLVKAATGLLQPSEEAKEIDKAAEEAHKKALDDIATMEGVLTVLADDDKFQYCLEKECVRKAVKHWTGIERLSQDESDDLFDDQEFRYQDLIMPAMKQFRKVEAVCKTQGRPFPFAEVLNGERELRSRQKEEQHIEEKLQEARESSHKITAKTSYGLGFGMQIVMMLFLLYQSSKMVTSGDLVNRSNISLPEGMRLAENPEQHDPTEWSKSRQDDFSGHSLHTKDTDQHADSTSSAATTKQCQGSQEQGCIALLDAGD